MIRNILCPTDFSENSKASVIYAISVAKENSAQLTLFHATVFPTIADFPCEPDGVCHWERLVDKLRMDHILGEAELKLRNFAWASFKTEMEGILWKTRVGLGNVADEIRIAALHEEVDLIVLARSKKPTVARFFSRSISEAVTKAAACPVLTIDASRANHRREGWRVPAFREILQSS
jgi:nucleotide-binding universal stress UspA family protein